MLAFGLSATDRGAPRFARTHRRASTIVDAPHGDVALDLPSIGIVGRRAHRTLRVPRQREPVSDSTSSRSVVMRWTRTCQGAPPATAVSMRTPGSGDHRDERDTLADLAAHARRRGRGGCRLAGSVTASIESVAAMP